MKATVIFTLSLMWIFGLNLIAGFILAWGYWTVNTFGYIFFVLVLVVDSFTLTHFTKQ